MVEAIHFIFIHDLTICLCSCFDGNVYLDSCSTHTTSCRDKVNMSSTSCITLCNSLWREDLLSQSIQNSEAHWKQNQEGALWENRGGKKGRKIRNWMTEKMYYKTWKFQLMYTVQTLGSVMSASQQLTCKSQLLLSYSFTVHAIYSNYGYCICFLWTHWSVTLWSNELNFLLIMQYIMWKHLNWFICLYTEQIYLTLYLQLHYLHSYILLPYLLHTVTFHLMFRDE